MQDSDSFISSYESDQRTRGEYEGVFSLKTLIKTWAAYLMISTARATMQNGLESKSRI